MEVVNQKSVLDDLPGFWIRRIHKLHRCVEEFIEAIFCDAIKYYPMTRNPDGTVNIHWKVRWWNPAAWIAFSRTVIFRDRCGCTFYLKSIEDREIPRDT